MAHGSTDRVMVGLRHALMKLNTEMDLGEKIVVVLIWAALALLASDAAFNLFSAITQGSFR